ncbi:MAG TPA: DUF3800 domain-containing protein [Acidobacteriaceae bacterium]|nr:DUF3800 domain-containing protein [Acidobacteriaceae bacterium]
MHLSMDDVSSADFCGMSAVAGYVAPDARWSTFNWQALIQSLQLKQPYLHTSEYVYNFPVVGQQSADDETVWLILSPYINSIRQALIDGGAYPLAVITEHDAYASLTVKEKAFVRSPEIHSFEVICYKAHHKFASSLRISNALSIQFDESQNACALYEAYARMKVNDPAMKIGLGAICFCDDKVHAPIQAADLFAHMLLRKWRTGKAGKPDPRAYTELTHDSKVEVITYDALRLKELARNRMKSGNKLLMDF